MIHVSTRGFISSCNRCLLMPVKYQTRVTKRDQEILCFYGSYILVVKDSQESRQANSEIPRNGVQCEKQNWKRDWFILSVQGTVPDEV